MNVYEALNNMRELSKNNIPFSIEFLTCNTTKDVTNGVKTVNKCLLRVGLSSEHSDKSNSLVAYTNLDTDEPRTFYIPLLLKFNNIDLE